MKQIPLTQGKFTIVDDDDFEELTKYKWQASHSTNTWYAVREEGVKVFGWIPRKAIKMHRIIMGLPHGDNRQIDHINGDGLDNRKANLRICTQTENMQNQHLRPDNQSGYKGVFRDGNKWRAAITIQKKKFKLGQYSNAQSAARAYDAAARFYFGEFSQTNFDGTESLSVETLREMSSRATKSGQTSKYRFVTWEKHRRKWMPRINIDGNIIRLGQFDTEDDAARAIDAYIKQHGLNRPLNFPGG